jgi:hypothetical protein
MVEVMKMMLYLNIVVLVTKSRTWLGLSDDLMI